MFVQPTNVGDQFVLQHQRYKKAPAWSLSIFNLLFSENKNLLLYLLSGFETKNDVSYCFHKTHLPQPKKTRQLPFLITFRGHFMPAAIKIPVSFTKNPFNNYGITICRTL